MRITPLSLLATLGLSLGSGLLLAQSPLLEITGAEERLTDNIRAHISLPDLACDVSSARLNRTLPGIRQNILRAGRALGYYHLRHTTRFQTVEDCWSLQIDVIPGDPVRFGDVNISIANDAPLFDSVLARLPFATGDQLDQGSYEAVKNQLNALAVDQGFFDTRYDSSELQLDLVNNTANINLVFNPGERYRFGLINIEEPEALSSEFIQRFIEIAPGDYYSSTALLSLRDSLNSSHYFNAVSVSPQIDAAINKEIPLRVRVGMRPQRVYGAGVGVTTDIGPRIRFDYEDRYLNRNGHSFTGNVGLSPIQQNLDLSYRLPMANPATESLEFSGGFITEDTETFKNDTTKLATTYSFINRWDWRQNYFVSMQHDDFTINESNEVTDLLISGISLNRTRADDALYPSRGWRLFGELKGASDALLSSESFLQLNIAGKLIESIGSGRVLLKFEAGTSWLDDVSQLPTSIQYFSGGDQSVRGYKYQSLGPLNENGEVVGGTHSLSAGVEYDFPISEAWKLAVFVDAGNSFNDFADFELKTGAGLGVRWLSPIGPIRVDLASALDNDNKLRLHITMGPDL